MIVKKFLSFTLLFVISVTLSACLQVNTGQNKQVIIPDGGFFISMDKGVTWEQRTSILSTSGTARNFSLDGVSTIVLDPSDPKSIYYGTVKQGMLYSYDRGVSWSLARNLGSGPKTINSIAVDPKNTCTVYASLGQKIFKTENCSRSWELIFTENATRVEVTSIAVDHFNSNNIYATLSRGDIIKSINGGESWQTVYRFKKKINKFYIDPNDSRRIYAAVDKEGLYRSDDSANTWQNINNIFDEFKIGSNIVDFQIFKNQPNLIFIATEKGIIRSTDRGKTWEQLALLPPEKKAAIVSIAVNSEDPKEIYYVTGATFYKSIDGGENWTPRSLPSTKHAGTLLLDYADSNILYLGLKSQ
jgi:photosystem II stability/assembly factor-like uncharacterized protein